MGDIAAYILLFSIGFGALYAYQHRRLRTKHVRLSVQHYNDCILKILLEKLHGKQQSIIVRIMARKDLELKNVQLELIDRQRNFHNIHLDSGYPDFVIPESLGSTKYFDLKLPYESIEEMIRASEFPTKRFRFAVEHKRGKKFKSHELAINRKGHIYKPDTGHYN
ncbi:MAG: hypothetical protein P8100_07600 [bacterium]|jgi:hypothetical protein